MPFILGVFGPQVPLPTSATVSAGSSISHYANQDPALMMDWEVMMSGSLTTQEAASSTSMPQFPSASALGASHSIHSAHSSTTSGGGPVLAAPKGDAPLELINFEEDQDQTE